VQGSVVQRLLLGLYSLPRVLDVCERHASQALQVPRLPVEVGVGVARHRGVVARLVVAASAQNIHPLNHASI